MTLSGPIGFVEADPSAEGGAASCALGHGRHSTTDGTRHDPEPLLPRLGIAPACATLSLNLGGRIVGLNDAACALLGYGRDEAVGLPWDGLLAPGARRPGRLVDELCAAMQTECERTERWLYRRDGTAFWSASVVTVTVDSTCTPTGFIVVLTDLTQARSEATWRDVLAAETVHRMKNMFATVQAVVNMTVRQSDVPEPFAALLGARLHALSAAYGDLGSDGGADTTLEALLRRTLAPYADGENLALHGPQLRLAETVLASLGLAFHELATNAAKHGAFSGKVDAGIGKAGIGKAGIGKAGIGKAGMGKAGRVDVSWLERKAADGAGIVEIVWRERGGPASRPPVGQGQGTTLLEHTLPRAFGGRVTLTYPPEGLECTIQVPLHQVSADAGSRTGTASRAAGMPR